MNNSRLCQIQIHTGLGPFLNEITFRSVLVDNLFSAEENDKVQVYELVEKDLRRGVIQPLHSTVFEVTELEKAYRYLSTGKHVGKGIFFKKILLGEMKP